MDILLLPVPIKYRLSLSFVYTAKVDLRTRGLTKTAVVEIVLGIFALIGGMVHLLFGIGGLISFGGTDVTLGAMAMHWETSSRSRALCF